MISTAGSTSLDPSQVNAFDLLFLLATSPSPQTKEPVEFRQLVKTDSVMSHTPEGTLAWLTGLHAKWHDELRDVLAHRTKFQGLNLNTQPLSGWSCLQLVGVWFLPTSTFLLTAALLTVPLSPFQCSSDESCSCHFHVSLPVYNYVQQLPGSHPEP